MAVRLAPRQLKLPVAIAACAVALFGVAMSSPDDAARTVWRPALRVSSPVAASFSGDSAAAVTTPSPARAPDAAAIGAAVGAIVQSLTAELAAGLPLHPAKAAYDECVREQSNCESLLADIINLAIANTQAKDRARSDDFGLKEWIKVDGGRAVRNSLVQMMAASSEPLERIAALIILKYGPVPDEQRTRPLPDSVYAALARRPIPEMLLLSRFHSVAAPSPAAASEFALLGHSQDSRARRAAFDALAHAQTATWLHDLVLGIEPGRDDWPSLTLAISKCGLACADTALHVLALGQRDARIALYEAAGLAPDGEREQLVALIMKHSPEIDADERAQRASMLDDALGK